MASRRLVLFTLLLLTSLMLASCNLSGEPEQEITLTNVPTSTPTLSQPSTLGVPTGVQVTTLPILTPGVFPTSIAFIPPTALGVIPSVTPSTISIVILSPISGNVVSNNVQVLGSAIHPNFLQYQLEYGPEPNFNNLWYTIGAPRQSTVLNGVLGIWSTNTIPDGLYQLRLRVYLRDGSNPQTVVNNIRVQNSAPTAVPTPTNSIPRPIAAFSQDRTSGEAPLVVRFTNRSTGQVSGYGWNFGDGSSSAEINPVHVFRSAGEFEVKLTVVGPGGQSNVSQIVTVNVNPPVALYDQNVASGPSPLSVQFTDRSTGNITDYRWDFGDGTTSNERSPRHVFTVQGTYNISLRVRGPGGTGRAFSVVTVSNPQVNPPVANFTPLNTGGNAPLGIQFTDTSTGQVTSRLWEFGDGTTSTDQNPIHQFASPGSYSVRLTVSGPGGTASQVGTVTVNRAPEAPNASFTANPTSGDAALVVRFTNTTTGDVTGYRWSFGDGTATDTSQSPTHTFALPGTYRVVLTALGQNGLQDIAEVEVSVTQPLAPPVADFSAVPTEGSAPLDVQFTNLSSGDQITSNWNFGDGQTQQTNESAVVHRFEQNGTYTVTLSVSGPGGPTSTKTGTITVTDRVQAAFEYGTLTDPPGLGVAFQDRSTGQIVSWAWNFGDGTTSTDQNPTHTFAAGGTYAVSLLVTGTDGVTSSVAQDVSVSEPLPDAPIANFTVTIDGLRADFKDASIGDVVTWTWDFGDGAASNEANPSHDYAVAGTYSVRLIVENIGGSTEITQDVTVSAPPPPAPVASFAFAVNNLDAQFTDTSTGQIDSWFWEFDDGTSSSNPSPSHTFPSGGTYSVRLTVANAGGSNQSSQEVTVEALPDAPVASFTIAVDNLNVQFTDTSQGTGITSWFWDFGDGTSSDTQNPAHSYGVGGTYVVSLTVTNVTSSATTSQPVTVAPALPPPPTSRFSFIVNNLSVQFTDESIGEAITAWTWDFGDGTSSTEQNPSHDYAAGGTYRVRLVVENAGGSDRRGEDVTVNAPLPDAPVSAFTFTVNNLDVQFSDLSSGLIDSYAWDFGDGTTSTQQSPAHTYPAAGTYTATLTVSNTGGSNATSQQVTVSAPLPTAPVAGFTFSATDLNVQFSDLSSGQIDSWSWDFGDGQFSGEQFPFHTYPAAGTYTATLTVSNAGGSNATSQQVTVNAPLPTAPVAGFTFSATDLNVQFSDLSSGQIDSWSWDFGDGQFSGEQFPFHTYPAAGTYTATLTVSNTGGSNATSQQVTVNAPLPTAPVAGFTFSATDLNVQFSDLSSGQIDSWSWDFGDGQFSGEQFPFHTYPAAGTYTATLTVSNVGGSNATSQQVTVNAPLPTAPVAGFTFSATDLQVQFTDTSTGSGISAWQWDFGDGQFSNEQFPFHTYPAAGAYNVTLSVSNAGGSNATTQQVIVKSSLPELPVADFSFSANELEVTFTDASSGEITDYLWEFGDGGTSAEANPVYSYGSAGTYTARLTVSNAAGSSSAEYDVAVESAPVEDSIADTTPVMPDINGLAGQLSGIFNSGGNNANVFAVIGDRSVSSGLFLVPFGDGIYELSDSGSNVEGVIQFYLAGDAGGVNSFSRVGSAVFADGLAANFAYDAGGCGDTVVACELDAINPAVTVISLGYRDARNGSNPDDFRSALQAIVDTVVNRGSIPVLLTPYTRPGEEAQIRDFAEIVIEVAAANDVPVLNVWRMVNDLSEGMSGNDLSVAGAGPDRLGDNQISRFGENARNFYALDVLRRILAVVGAL
ncbi:MAG: PKD domain-containing protein [Chloroflexi bacterium]|nr:PKD domain-containing protein [Chloroflexota bacterium]